MSKRRQDLLEWPSSQTQAGHLQVCVQNADGEGTGELTIEEFCEQLGPYLGNNLSKQQVTQLFMKIDADAGGTVDWDEFSNYMFLKRAENEDDNATAFRFFPMVRAGCQRMCLCAIACAAQHAQEL